jgi:hypothetical protein
MNNFEDRVLLDEFGGGVAAIFSKERLVAYRLGYSDDKTISDIKIEKTARSQEEEDGQLYFDFMGNYINHNPNVSSKSFI